MSTFHSEYATLERACRALVLTDVGGTDASAMFLQLMQNSTTTALELSVSRELPIELDSEHARLRAVLSELGMADEQRAGLEAACEIIPSSRRIP